MLLLDAALPAVGLQMYLKGFSDGRVLGFSDALQELSFLGVFGSLLRRRAFGGVKQFRGQVGQICGLQLAHFDGEINGIPWLPLGWQSVAVIQCEEMFELPSPLPSGGVWGVGDQAQAGCGPFGLPALADHL